MESKPIANMQNIINSGELFARVKWLEQELNYRCSDEYSAELKALKSFVENIQANASASTYEPGVDLIRDSCFQEYITALERSDTAATPKAAFSPVDFNGVIYWLRQES
ncbi:MAG: hypothetical protein M3Q16_08120 [Pseudomonadota bacterium]|nr:hypothetical protein [Pseudomonadota bacterium]